QSSVGAELRRGAGEIDGLAATEQALDGTGADVLHLRCGLFFTNLLLDPAGLEEGVLRVTWPVDRPLPWVDPRDIAEVAAVRLLAGGWSGREVQAVHGPEDLTYEQVATIIAEVTGRPMRAEQIPDDAMREGLRAVGLTDAQIEALLGMSIGLRQGFVPENPRTFTTTTLCRRTPTRSTAPSCRGLLDTMPIDDADEHVVVFGDHLVGLGHFRPGFGGGRRQDRYGGAGVPPGEPHRAAADALDVLGAHRPG